MPRHAKKADVIRALPRDMPLKQVQNRMRKAGLGSVAKAYVAKVRSHMHQIERAVPLSNGNGHADDHGEPRMFTSASIEAVPAAPLSSEQQLMRLVRVLGTERVRLLLDRYEAL